MTSLKIEVDPRVIMKLPEMFGGNEQALRELLQNAYRSGAQHVRVEWNPKGKILVVSDDGRGEGEPQNVFFPGRTGWDESAVKDPAGLGLYALLTEETEWIDFETQTDNKTGWRARLDKDNLARREVEIQELKTGTKGTCVSIMYKKNPWTDFPFALAKARGLYPYELKLVVSGKEELIPSKNRRSSNNECRTFHTQVGDVVLEKDGWKLGGVEAVWEFQVILSDELDKALERAATSGREKSIAMDIFCSNHYGIRWFVDQLCGVRPRLPDRSELIQGLALDCCAHQIVDAVVEEVLEKAKEWENKWPENVATWNLDAQSLADRWASKSLVIRLMERAGWIVVQFKTGDGIDLECDGDGSFDFWPQYKEVLARNPIPVGSTALAAAINREGGGRVYAEAVDPVGRSDLKRATFEGLEVVDGCRVALAKRITFEGVPDLSYLTVEGNEWWEGIPELEESEALVVFAGTADQFLATLDRSWMMQIAMLSFELYKEKEFLYADGEKTAYLNEQELGEILVKEISKAFRKPMVSTCRKYYALKEATQLGERACGILEQLEGSAGAIKGELAYTERIRTIREEVKKFSTN